MKSTLIKQIFVILVILMGIKSNAQTQTITATFTADNFYAVYAGDDDEVTRKLLPNGNTNFVMLDQASELWSPQSYTFQMASHEWLYIIAARDRSSAQGLIGEFKGDRSLLTGDPSIQVFPTNQDFSGVQNGSRQQILAALNQSVNMASISNSIRMANNSSGWKTPHSGPLNGATGGPTYSYGSLVNNVSNQARWIWNSNQTLPIGNATPFVSHSSYSANIDGNYLIFRFPVSALNIQKPSIPIGSDCNCWKPLGTKYNGLDLDKLGRITPFQIDKNNSTSNGDRQVLDVALNHVYPEYHRDATGAFGIKFTFAMKPELRTYLESYLRYINNTFKCVNMIRVSYSINDVTGLTGLPNGSEVKGHSIEMYIDNNGNITYSIINDWNSYTFNSYNINLTNPLGPKTPVNLLPQIGKEYKTGITIVALSKGGTNEFEDTKKCGFNWECSVAQAFYSWVPSSSKSSNPSYEVVDKNNNVIKVFSSNNQNKK
jgi:hypothetical protein